MAGNPYLWSTIAANNETVDPDVNWAEGQLPSTVNGSARAMMAGIAGWRQDLQGVTTAGGSGNAYTITAKVAYTALETGLTIGSKPGSPIQERQHSI